MQNFWFYLSALLIAVAISVSFFTVIPYVSRVFTRMPWNGARIDSGVLRRYKLRLGKWLWQYIPWGLRQHLARIVVEDGEQFVYVVHRMLGTQIMIITATLLSFVVVQCFLTLNVHLAWCVIALLTAAIAPYLQYKSQLRKRQRQLQIQLPFFMDIFALSIEAGTGLVLALQSTAESLPEGLLKTLVEQAIFDMKSGLSREHSFKKLGSASALVELESFANSIENAVQMGLSLAPVLRAQSDQSRQERFLRAEKMALEAPVKMLFPIVTCIFPCTFLVIAYPVIYELLSSLA